MVSDPVENDYQKFNSFTRLSKRFAKARKENSSSNSKRVTETGGTASIGKVYVQEGYQEMVSTLSKMPKE